MFNGLRSALETVSQQLDANASPENGARSSMDMNGSPISSLRRSFATQRQNSTDSVPKSGGTSPPAVATTNTRKSTLEERLRRAATQAAAASSDNATSTSKPDTPSSVTRGRTNSTASQKTAPATAKASPSTTPSRVTSPSPATRGRPTETSKAAVSRTASPATTPASKTTTTTRTTASPAPAARIGSRPPSRAGSPAPGATAARASSRPPSRTGSPAPPPATRTSSRPPSRTGSPAPAPRTRASELSGRTSRAPSPSPLRSKTPPASTPLRRGSVTLSKTPLGREPEEDETKGEKAKEEDGEAENAEENAEADQVPENAAVVEKTLDDTSNKGFTTSVDPSMEAAPVSVETQIDKAPPADTTEVAATPSPTVPDPSPEVPTSPQPTIQPPEVTLETTPSLSATVVPSESPATDNNAPSTPADEIETQVTSQEEEAPPLAPMKPSAAQPDAETPAPEDTLETTVPAEPPLSPKVEAPSTSSIEGDVKATPTSPKPDPVSSPVVASTPSTNALKSPTIASTSPNLPSPPQTTSIAETPTSPALETEQNNISPPVNDRTAEVENLQARLKEVEQRFSDVSTSFKRLQAEKLAADAILKENTPLEGIHDSNAIKEFFTNLRAKDEVFQEEIKRLQGKLEVQDDRMEDLRETHKLESHSLTDELKKLRNQLKESEALFEAAQRATTNVEGTSDKLKQDITRLEKEVENTKSLAKEEEEKRVKAISLLKTVRQKLVKAEKDREDALREMATLREKATGDKDREQAERIGFQRELEATKSTHEQEIATLKAQYERDFAAMKQRYEQDISAVRGQQELDLTTAKTSYSKELTAKSSQISTLENSLNSVTRDKNAFFDQLQLRQAEVESAQSHLESLQHQNTELEFQLRESNDRLALLKEEYAELQREAETRSREPTTSPDEIARMVAAAEAKYELKVSEMKRNISVLEKERYDSEADWSKKLKEKVKEVEDLKRMLGSAARTKESEENTIAGLKEELDKLREGNKRMQREVADLPVLRDQVVELERSSREHDEEVNMKIHVLEKTIEEHKAREAQLKQGNKTLRDELRKVQSSAALLERQRNPGVGYWTTRTSDGPSTPTTNNGSATDSRTSISGAPRPSISGPSPDTPSRTGSPAPSTTGSNKDEEEVNLEYLRNVILQFLEHKEMRPHLVKVMSIILHFTPQETRRLIAKV